MEEEKPSKISFCWHHMNGGILTNTLFWAILVFLAAAAVRVHKPAVGMIVLLYCVAGTGVSIVQAAIAGSRYFRLTAPISTWRKALAVMMWTITIVLYFLVITVTAPLAHGNSWSAGGWLQAAIVIILWFFIGSAASILQLGILFRLEGPVAMYLRWRHILFRRPGVALASGSAMYAFVVAIIGVLLSLQNSSSSSSTLISTGSLLVLLLISQYLIAYWMLSMLAETTSAYLEDVLFAREPNA